MCLQVQFDLCHMAQRHLRLSVSAHISRLHITTDSVEHAIDKSAYQNEEETVSDVTSLYRLAFESTIYHN